MAYHVFWLRQEGLKIRIPAEMMHQAPFAKVRRAIECYEVLASKARRIPTQRQTFILNAWSPDGTQLLCWAAGAYGAMRQTLLEVVPSVSYGGGLKSIDVESGAERHLVRGFRGLASWSPDGKYIAYTDHDHNLCLIPPEGGQSRILVQGPVWSLSHRPV